MAQRFDTDVSRRRRGPKPGTPRAPRMTRAQRESQLLDVAETTFAERGYSDATMEEIAGRAGITKPVIYDHFGSKERLLSAVVERNRAEMLASTATALDSVGPRAEPEEYFRAGVRAFLEFFQTRQDSFRTYQQQSAVLAAAGSDIEAARQAQAAEIADRFGLLPAIPDLPQVSRQGLAEIVIATNERVTAWWLRNPQVTLDEAVEIVMAALWTGFGGMLRPPEQAGRARPANGSAAGDAEGDAVEDVVLGGHDLGAR